MVIFLVVYVDLIANGKLLTAAFQQLLTLIKHLTGIQIRVEREK
jgi:hypothetical protein